MSKEELDKSRKVFEAVNNLFDENFREDKLKLYVAFKLIGSTAPHSRDLPEWVEWKVESMFDALWELYEKEGLI